MSRSLAPVNAKWPVDATGGASVVVEPSVGASLTGVPVEPDAADVDWVLRGAAVVVLVEELVVEGAAVDELVATVVAVVVGGT